MHGYKCVGRDVDEMFYRGGSSRSKEVILAKMKLHFCEHRAILDRDVKPLECEDLDPYGLK